MTGTRVVKLKLEDGQRSGNLPNLKDPLVEKALRLYDLREGVSVDPTEAGFWDYHNDVTFEAGDLNVSPSQLQEVYSSLESRHGGDSQFSIRAGLLMTALIQSSKASEFNLTVASPLDYIGFSLRAENNADKRVTINGNVGDHTGDRMRGGEIHVTGDAGDYSGYSMHGGIIRVDGSVKDDTGVAMVSGKIEVGGNAGQRTARLMRGGEVHVHGNAGDETADQIEAGTLKVDGTVSHYGDIPPTSPTLRIYEGGKLR
ncbi:MAG: hypothetical protein V1921_06225 [Candidatus Altiarchaeota archaeon]